MTLWGTSVDGDAEAAGSSGSSSGGGASAASASPAYNSYSEWMSGLQNARNCKEGLRVIFRVVPVWVPVAGLLSAAGLYFVTFRVRLFLAKWRVAERRRAERKYELLDNLRGVSMMQVGAAVEALGDDDDDDGDEDEEDEDADETAVSMRDIDEFRSSLGIRLPRDEDLLGIVERMLIVDSIPDGWVLYRTTAGIIRFMNLNTQELFFFHPGRRAEEIHIKSELEKRNRQAMESKYSFSYEDEGLNTHSLQQRSVAGGGAAARNGGAGGSHSGGASSSSPSPPESRRLNPSAADFEGDGFHTAEDVTQNSTFKRMFTYFLEKEQKKIEQDVIRSRSTRDGDAAPGAGGSHSMNEPSGGGGRGGDGSSAGVSHRQSASMTYRVVSSSSIRGNRASVVSDR